MDTMIARAFLAYQIKKAGLDGVLLTLREYELKELPTGRYLHGFEIIEYLTRIGKKSSSLNIEIKDPNAKEIALGEALWTEYRNRHHPTLRGEEIHRWEDWACAQFGHRSGRQNE